MIYERLYLVNPYFQRVENMYGKGGKRVYKAELRPPKVDPYFEKKKHLRQCWNSRYGHNSIHEFACGFGIFFVGLLQSQF